MVGVSSSAPLIKRDLLLEMCASVLMGTHEIVNKIAFQLLANLENATTLFIKPANLYVPLLTLIIPQLKAVTVLMVLSSSKALVCLFARLVILETQLGIAKLIVMFQLKCL